MASAPRRSPRGRRPLPQAANRAMASTSAPRRSARARRPPQRLADSAMASTLARRRTARARRPLPQAADRAMLKQQIQPRSLSTACSSNRPTQLRKNRKGLLGSEAKSSLFSDSEATSSGSVGVLKQKRRKKVKEPTDLNTALQYMKEHGCNGVEFLKYKTALEGLEDEFCLGGFLALKTYEDRKEHFDDLLANGLFQTPSCKLANTPPGEQ